MTILKREFNDLLFSQELNEPPKVKRIESRSKTIREIQESKSSTVFGDSNNQTISGIQGLETTSDFTSNPKRGESLVQFQDGTKGQTSNVNLSQSTMNYGTPILDSNLDEPDSDGSGNLVYNSSNPTGTDSSQSVTTILSQITGISPDSKPNTSIISGSSPESLLKSMEGINKKSLSFDSDIRSLIQENTSESDYSQFTSVISPTQYNDRDGIIKDVSGIPSLNKNASQPEEIINSTQNPYFRPGSGNAFSEISDTILGVGRKIGQNRNGISDFSQEWERYNSAENQEIYRGTSGSLQDILEYGTDQSFNYINGLITGPNMSRKEVSNIIELTQDGNTSEATRILLQNNEDNTDEMNDVINHIGPQKSTVDLANKIEETAKLRAIPDSEIAQTKNRISIIQDGLANLDTTISGSIVVPFDTQYENQITIGENITKWRNDNEDEAAYSYIDSKEELGSEFRAIRREITECVVHATETYTNANIGSEDINRIHKDLGEGGILYHYVIKRDGTLQRGRPVEIESPHSRHAEYTIAVVLVGGINISTGDDNPLDNRDVRSFTREQMTTLETFLAAFYGRYPGGQVVGHNDIEVGHEDPYFDVIDYCRSVFKKETAFTSTETQDPFSPEDLV